MDNLVSGIILFLAGIILAAAFGIILAFPLMWCWNYTIVYLFGVKTLTWGHAWCLSFVANALIKSTLTNTKS